MNVKVTLEQPDGLLVLRVDEDSAQDLRKLAKGECKAEATVTREQSGDPEPFPSCDVAICTNDVSAMKQCLISHGIDFV